MRNRKKAKGLRTILENKIISRIIGSLRHPVDFFKKIKPEKGFRDPFFFFMIVISVTFIFLTYHHVSLFNSLMQEMVTIFRSLGLNVRPVQIDLKPSVYIIAYFILVTSMVISSFLWYFITHLCVRLVGGKNGYYQTYKAMTYSLSADYLALPAFIISMISLVATLEGSRIGLVIFVISFILYSIPTFYRLYLRLVGIEKLQEISKLRAFIAAYILAYVLVFIAIVVIDIILIAIISLFMFLF